MQLRLRKIQNVDEKFLENFLMKMWLTCEINEIILSGNETFDDKNYKI